jgi:hypothetical protein
VGSVGRVKSRFGAQLLLHGIVLILFGAAAGFVYTGVLTGEIDGAPPGWRFAHLNGLVNGAILVGLGGASAHICLPKAGQRWLVLLTISGSYSNVIASILGATLGHRGLSAVGPGANRVVFGLFAFAVVALLAGLIFSLVGAWRALRSASGESEAYGD